MCAGQGVQRVQAQIRSLVGEEASGLVGDQVGGTLKPRDGGCGASVGAELVLPDRAQSLGKLLSAPRVVGEGRGRDLFVYMPRELKFALLPGLEGST